MKRRSHSWGLSLAWVAAGAVLLLLEWLDILPAAWGALLLSENGVLSDAFLGSLQHGQRVLGWVCILVGAGSPLLIPLLRRGSKELNSIPARLFSAVLFFASLAAVLSIQWFLLESIPHVTDETSHAFQARIFAQGRLTADLPACYEHFWQHNVIMSPSGRWHTKYYPGNALWIAWGQRVGLAHLPIPVAWSLFLVLLVNLLERFVPRQHARAVVLLCALSPMGILLAASFMSHITFIFFAVAGLAAVAKGTTSPKAKGRFLLFAAGGFFMGLAAMTRPQDLAVLGILCLATLPLLPSDHRNTLLRKSLLPGLLGAATPLLFLLAWNHACYGSALGSGYNFGVNPSLTPIINDRLGFTDTFTPRVASRNMIWTLIRFDASLFGWPSSLAPLLLLLLGAAWKKPVWIGLLALASYPLLYYFFPYYAFEYEARYYTPLIPFVALLNVAALVRLYRILQRTASPEFAMQAILSLLLVGYGYTFFYTWPHRIWPVYGNQYEQAGRVIQQTVHQAGITNAIVLIDANGADAFRYSSGFIFNDPDLRNDVIYGRDLGAKNHCLAEHYPDRTLYRFEPRSDWQSGTLVHVSVTRAPTSN